MKSASNGGILKGCFQMLRVRVFLVVTLGAGHMAQWGTERHQSRVAVRETAYHTSVLANFQV